MTGPLGNSEFCFPRISMFPDTKSRETLRFSGNKIKIQSKPNPGSDGILSKSSVVKIMMTSLTSCFDP